MSLADAETVGDAVWADRSPRDAAGLVDRTHLNATGGEVVGRMVADALRNAVPELAPYFPAAVTASAPFRIIGYYSLRAAMAADPAAVPFDKLTHVNLSFLNPEADGTFSRDFSALAPFVTAAHRRGVKVLASIGGGSAHPYYHALLKDDQRGLFIGRLVGTALQYELDGIDVDLEGSDIDGNYETFVVDLGTALRARGKLMTSAIAIFYKDALSDRALAQYDFVNIMAYDHTGPWRPEKPGPHSTYEHAATALEYFGVTRKIPREKMVLGVPFYGYGYGPELTSPAVTMTFGEITSAFAGSELVDQWPLPGGKTIYYNGIPTIKLKTALAREKASGIMIWQILGDAAGEKSLLAAITEVAAAASSR
jgi:chitinase